MKGLDPLIGFILVIAISLAAILIVLDVGIPATQRTNEILLFNEIKGNMMTINSKITETALQGQGSSSRITLSINGGHYSIDAQNDEIRVSMDSNYQLVGSGENYTEDSIFIEGFDGQVIFSKTYDNIDITNGGSFGKGSRIINIKNIGYASGKQIMEINVS